MMEYELLTNVNGGYVNIFRGDHLKTEYNIDAIYLRGLERKKRRFSGIVTSRYC